MTPDRLGTPLKRLLRRVEASYPDQAHRVWEVWQEAVGPDLAGRSHPLSLRRGVLTVGVTSAAWMQQLSFLRGQLTETVNRALGVDLVREIRLKTATTPPPPPRSVPQPPPPWLSEPLPDEAVRAIEAEVGVIDDPVLRESIRQVRIRAEQVRRFREGPEGVPPPRNTVSRGRGGRGEG